MAVDYGDPPVEEAVRAARASSRRRQVLDAAVTVMGKNGFHQMSMQDLAALPTIVRILDVFRDQPGRAQIKELEIATAAPLRAAIETGIALLAHARALKHWHFGPVYAVDEYIALHIRRVLVSLVADERRADYAHLPG